MTQSTIKLTPAAHGVKVSVKTPIDNGWSTTGWYLQWADISDVELLSDVLEDLAVKDFKLIVQQLGELHREHGSK